MAKFNHIDVRGTKKVPSAFGNVFISADSISAAKTVTFPDGYLNGATPEPNLAFKVVFANGHNAANASSYLSLNGIVVVSNQNGVLAPIPIHAMTEGGSTVYKVLQANTVLELYYTADYDGNNAPAFVVIGNPVVLSSADYTIYADGHYAAESFYPIGSIYINAVDKNPADILHFGTWERVAKNKTIWGASNNGEVGSSKSAGLPNITGYISGGVHRTGDADRTMSNLTSYNNGSCNGGALKIAGLETDKKKVSMSDSSSHQIFAGFEFSAHESNSIYGNSSTVQPPAYVLNIWKRTN